MKAQISLTPTESKKLIAKAIVKLPAILDSYEKSMLVLHPSSSTYFIVEELLGKPPETDIWVCGAISPRGACVEASNAEPSGEEEGLPDRASDFSHSWVLEKGKFYSETPLKELLEKMDSESVYVKGVNALDPEGNTGVLAGNPEEAGTIGKVIGVAKKKGFKILFPVGLEKLVPFSVFEVSKIAKRSSYDYAMGMSVSLIPCDKGQVVTEVTAGSIISGVEVFPIASGGLGGGEGSITFIVSGEKDQVNNFIAVAESVKGAVLPPVKMPNCEFCKARKLNFCFFPVNNKPWVKKE